MKFIPLLILSLCCILLTCGCVADSKDDTSQPEEEDTIGVSCVYPDAPGNDHNNLNGEWIKLLNYGENPINIEGWTIQDEYGHTFQFPKLIVDSRKTVTLHTGSGTYTKIDGDIEAYWGADRAIWNNEEGIVYLFNDEGVLIHRRPYSRY